MFVQILLQIICQESIVDKGGEYRQEFVFFLLDDK